MLLNDPLEHGRRARMVPHRVRIHDRDWPVHAYAQTIGFRAIDQRFGADEIQFLETALEVFPRLQSHFPGSAFRFRLVRAKKNVPAVLREAERA